VTPGEPERPGFATPEEAAFGDLPPQYVEILGSVVDDDHATVWLLTNEAPDYESYTVFCEREGGRWYDAGGTGGFNSPTPDEVRDRARALGYDDSANDSARQAMTRRLSASPRPGKVGKLDARPEDWRDFHLGHGEVGKRRPALPVCRDFQVDRRAIRDRFARRGATGPAGTARAPRA
jgi:hypothetical protein